MRRDLFFLTLYDRWRRYSVNALLGALEKDPPLAGVSIVRTRSESDLVREAERLASSAEALRSGVVVVGLSFTSAGAVQAGRLAREIRAAWKRSGESAELLLLAGGPHATALPIATLATGFDAAVVGEGEETFRELLERLGEDGDWREVPGIASLDDCGRVRLLARRSFVSLDEYPPFPTNLGLGGHIEITRGCPHACGFCQVSHLHGTRPRHRSVEAVRRAVSAMMHDGRVDFRFITPDAFAYGSRDGRETNHDAVEALLRGVREEAGSVGRLFFGNFPSEVRPEHVTPEMLELVKRFADNRAILIGAQSGSDRMLSLCNRGHDVASVLAAARLTLEAGLDLRVDFIFGLPGETAEDRRQTVEVMGELTEMGARIHGHTFMPVVGTAFGDRAPGQVTPDLLEELHRLVGQGLMYGNWREQEVLGKSIARGRRGGNMHA